MKKVLLILGGFFMLIILAIAGMGGYTWYQSFQYEKTAVPYIEKVIPEFSQWKPDIAKQYMVPEVLQGVSNEDLSKIFKLYSKLGKYKKMSEPDFTNLTVKTTSKDGEQTLVTYTINAEYENGNAIVTIVLLDLGNTFQVYSFNVNSTALAG